MSKKKVISLFLLVSSYVFAQEIRLDPFLSNRFEIAEIQTDTLIFSAVKPFYYPQNLGDSLKNTWFFQDNINFVRIKKSDFDLTINPVFYFSIGADNSDSTHSYYRNTRGGELFAKIGDKWSAYLQVLETQEEFPLYIQEAIAEQKSIPQALSYKPFKTTAYDYNVSRGFVAYQGKYTRIKFGHDKLFIGDGYQSLVFSDYVPPHFQLQLRTKIWKLEYLNHWGELLDFEYNKPDIAGPFTKKYIGLHQLSFAPRNNIRIRAFESVVWKERLELQYLNPIIFYRAIEFSLGSPDNVLMGTSFRWDIKKTIRLYSQIVLDDFNFGNRNVGQGWWGNKFSLQGGIKIYEPFQIPNLVLQAEANAVRPYTYAHNDTVINYSHFKLPLAHTYGANLRDFHFLVYYSFWKNKVNLRLRYSLTQQGIDPDTLNYGSNIFISDSYNRPLDYGVKLLQGTRQDISMLEAIATIKPFKIPLFVDVIFYKRDLKNPRKTRSDIGGRLNLRYSVALRDFRR